MKTLLALFLLTASSASLAADGMDIARDALVREDGTILLTGTAHKNGAFYAQIFLACLKSDGTLAREFGNEGITRGGVFEGDANLSAISGRIIRSIPGKGIVVFGNQNTPADNRPVPASHDLAIVRYLDSGKLDTSFGEAGAVRYPYMGDNLHVFDSADGNFWITGRYADEGERYYGYVGKLLPNGQFDTRFGKDHDGWNAYLWGTINHLIELADGQIVLAGNTGREHSERLRWPNYDQDLLMFSLTADGTKESASRAWDSGTNDFAQTVVTQSDGKLLILRTSDWRFVPTKGMLALHRFLPDGAIDTAFGKDGFVEIDNSEIEHFQLVQMVVQSDGKILIAGDADRLYGDPVLFRFNADGSKDLSFGEKGHVRPALKDYGSDTRRVIVQNDGRILIVGGAIRNGLQTQNTMVIRLLPDGTPDLTFGKSGQVVLNLSE